MPMHRCTGECGADKPKESYTTSQWAKGPTRRKCIPCTKAPPHVIGDDICARSMCHQQRMKSHLSLCSRCAPGAECQQMCGPDPDEHTRKCESLHVMRTIKRQINTIIGHIQADLPMFGDEEDYEEYIEAVNRMTRLTEVGGEPTEVGGEPGGGDHGATHQERTGTQEALYIEPPPCRGCVTGVCTRLSSLAMARRGVMLCEFCAPAPCGCCFCQSCECE